MTKTAFIAALSAGLFAAAGAFAHAHLHASTPAADTTVAAPKTLHLMFSEKLEPGTTLVITTSLSLGMFIAKQRYFSSPGCSVY